MNLKLHWPRTRFYRIFLYACLAFLAIYVVGMIFFWLYIADYENSLPEHVMKRWTAQCDRDWTAELLNDYDMAANLSPYEDWDTVLNTVILDRLGTDFHWRKKSDEFSEVAPVYVLSCGEFDLARVTLQSHNRSWLGHTVWKVDSVTPFPDFSSLQNISVTIVVRDDLKVRLGNQSLKPEQLVSSKQLEASTEWDKTLPLEKLPTEETYVVSGLYSVPPLSVQTSDGYSVMTEWDGETYRCNQEDLLLDVEIILPDRAEISVNGLPLEDTLCIEKSLPYGEDALWDIDYTAAPTRCKYVLQNLLCNPECTATLRQQDGKEVTLTPKILRNGHTVTIAYGYPPSMMHSYTVLAPEESILTIGGKKITAQPQESGLDYPCLLEMQAYLTVHPKLDRYVIDNLFENADFSAELNGQTLIPYCNPDEPTTVTFYRPLSSPPEEAAASMSTFLDNYIRYNAAGYDRGNISNNYLNWIYPYLIPGSLAEAALKSSTYMGVAWRWRVDLEKKETKIHDWRFWEDNCISFVADISFTGYNNDPEIACTTTESATMQIFLKQSKGSWKIFHLELLDSDVIFFK